MTKIVIVDDEKLFAECICKLLTKRSNFKVLDYFQDGQLLLNNLDNNQIKPDLIILDLKMNNLNGVDTAKILHKKYPKIKVMILSSYYNPVVIKYLSKYNISSFLPKNIGQQDLLKGINNLINNGSFFLPEYHKFLISENKKFKKPILNVIHDLTNKEIEVLKYICHGYTNQEIANKLYKSIRTIEGHRQHIIDKTGAKNTAGIVVFAIAHKLIDINKKLLNYHINPAPF